MGKIPSTTECNPGFTPARYAVIIAPEVLEEKTAGGIIRPDVTREKEELATLRGRLVAMSPLAFTYHDQPGVDPECRRHAYPEHPKAGDAVVFKKYAGILVKGEDGKEYRVCNDEDVVGVIG